MKKYGVFYDADKRGWYAEMQENSDTHWVIVAGPFNTEAEARGAIEKMRED